MKYTKFYQKHFGIRNNIKSDMIRELIFNLDKKLKSNYNNTAYNYANEEIIVNVPKSKMNANYKQTIKVDDYESIPCFNIDCEWVKYQEIYHKNGEFSYLPIINNRMMCTICDKFEKGEISYSSLNLLSDGRIFIK